MIAYRLFLYWLQKKQEDRQERSGRRRQSHFDGVDLDVVEIVCSDSQGFIRRCGRHRNRILPHPPSGRIACPGFKFPPIPDLCQAENV